MFSFDPDWQSDWQWSEKYATQPEILRYLNHVADKLRPAPRHHVRHPGQQARWDEDATLWRVRTDAGDDDACRLPRDGHRLPVHAQAPRHRRHRRFAGEVYFTSRWPHERVDFTGKRVAVIGTGSSGIQTIPRIAAQAARAGRSSSARRTSRSRPTTARWRPSKLAQLRRRARLP